MAAYALATVTLLNFLNYIDRYILAAVLPRIKSDLALTDFDLGLLANAFLVAYFLTSPIFGPLGDRGSRTRLMAAGVAAWSVATALAGVARSFAQLLAARAGVGVGEAAYATVSPALLSDYFPKDRRGRAFAIFYVAIPVGSAVGFLLGGVLERSFGWRNAFYAVGVPGLLMALVALTVADPPRGMSDEEGESSAALPLGDALRALSRNFAYVGTVAGYAAYTFALGGLAFWMPTYLERVRGIELARADTIVGAVTVVAGLAGTFVGGFIGDFLTARVRNGHLWLSGVATLAAVPSAWAALYARSPSMYLGNFALAEFLLFLSTGPVNVMIVDVVPIAIRATAMAVSIFAIHAFGDAISPSAIGALSDRYGLATGIIVVPTAIALSGLLWMGTAQMARQKSV
jgi:MFS family permease